jgi:hypothetical protein
MGENTEHPYSDFNNVIFTPEFPIDQAVKSHEGDLVSFILGFANIRFPELTRNDPNLISKVMQTLSEIEEPAIKHLQGICEGLAQKAYNPS